jgi:hypothetical protein
VSRRGREARARTDRLIERFSAAELRVGRRFDRVAGIAASAGSVADPGGAPDVAIVAPKVLDSMGNGFISDTLAGLDWIAANHLDTDVVNLSLGGGMFEGDCDSTDAGTMALADSIDDLEQNGTVVVAGSGNNRWSDFMIAPACIAKAVSVGAVWDADVGEQTIYNCTDETTQADQVTCWSNASTTTDVFAPGGRRLAGADAGRRRRRGALEANAPRFAP